MQSLSKLLLESRVHDGGALRAALLRAGVGLIHAAEHHDIAAYVSALALYDIAADRGHVAFNAAFYYDVAADGYDSLLNRAAHDDRLSEDHNVAVLNAFDDDRSHLVRHGRDCLRASLGVRRGSRQKKSEERRNGAPEVPGVPPLNRSV